MPDALLTTVKARQRTRHELGIGSGGSPYDETVREIDALLARCEEAEARVRELSEHHAFEVVDPVGGPVAAPCAIEGCRYAELVAERDAARGEAARLRDILKSIIWHQDGDSIVYVCALCHGMHPSCERNGRWVAGTEFGHKAGCALAALDTPAREGA